MLPAHPRTRRFPACGSSRESFAHSGVPVDYPGRWLKVPLQQVVEPIPWEPAPAVASHLRNQLDVLRATRSVAAPHTYCRPTSPSSVWCTVTIVARRLIRSVHHLAVSDGSRDRVRADASLHTGVPTSPSINSFRRNALAHAREGKALCKTHPRPAYGQPSIN